MRAACLLKRVLLPAARWFPSSRSTGRPAPLIARRLSSRRSPTGAPSTVHASSHHITITIPRRWNEEPSRSAPQRRRQADSQPRLVSWKEQRSCAVQPWMGGTATAWFQLLLALVPNAGAESVASAHTGRDSCRAAARRRCAHACGTQWDTQPLRAGRNGVRPRTAGRNSSKGPLLAQAFL